MPNHLVDDAPRAVEEEGGWLVGRRLLANLGLNAVAGHPPEESDEEPRGWDEMRKGAGRWGASLTTTLR